VKLRATALLAAGLAVGGVWAGEGNYRDYIVGERAAGMGGAALGLATSVESCFFNPGGLPYTDSSTVSLSASLYGFADYTVDDGWGPGKNIDVDSFLVVPTTFGSVWKLNRDWAFALSAFVPDMARSNDLEAYVNQYDYFKYNKDDQSLWLGPSAGVRIDDRFSVGISVFGVYRTYSWFRDIIRAATYTWSEDIKYNDLSILALLGARYQLSPNWILGVTFQAPSVHLTGSGEYLIKYSYGDGNLVNYVDDVDTENTIPAQIAAGIAYEERGRFALALDVIYHFSADFNRVEGEDQFGLTWAYPMKYDAVVDFSLGGEYYIKDRYPIRAGFFTSLSASPDADPQTSYYPAHINKYGLTLSIGRETQNTTMNIGLNYSWGSGEYIGWNDDWTLEKVDASESFLYLFLGSSYLF